MKIHTKFSYKVFVVIKLILCSSLFISYSVYANGEKFPFIKSDYPNEKKFKINFLNDTLAPPVKENATVISPDPNKRWEADWTFQLLPDHFTNSLDLHNFPVGDFNGDGYDDLTIATQTRFRTQAFQIIYYGSSQGLPEFPQSVYLLEPHALSMDDLLYLNSVGDINGDGFDDICSNGISKKASFYLGSDTGLSSTPNIQIDIPHSLYYPHPAGDVNGDGYDDVILLSIFTVGDGLILFGGPNGIIKTEKWPDIEWDPEDERSQYMLANDFNKDGYGDIIYWIQWTNYIIVNYGSADGLKPSSRYFIPSPKAYVERVITGDFDGDGYGDLFYTTQEDKYPEDYRYKLIELRGSPDGLELENPNEFFDYNEEGWWNGKLLNFLGDINNDGMDDFLYNKNIYLGAVKIEYLDNEDRFYNFSIENNFITGYGDFNGDGSNDLGSINELSQIFYLASFEPFKLTCPEIVETCYAGAGENYIIPTANFSNSHFARQNFYIYEESPSRQRRIGPGNNASGAFYKDSEIIWQAVGYNNKRLTCTTEFKFKHVPITNVTIKDAYAVNPGGDPNTIYVGHGPNGFRLAALPQGGGAPYTYLWSNGSTEKNPRITERVPGDYPYWVQLINKDGCISADTVVVKVENALCSSPLVDAVMQSYPMILQNTILSNLIKNNSKIAVCKDGETICLARSVVDTRLSRPGYSLGACNPGIIPAQAFMTQDIEEILSGKLKVMVAPNPATTRFQLNIASITNESVSIRITDINGRVVEQVNRAATNTSVFVGEKLQPGIYFAEIQGENEKQVVKLVKIN